MRSLLIAIFATFFGGMLAVTVWACQTQAIWKVPQEVISNPWFIATLFDTYFSFLTIYVWVCVRERSLLSKLLWLVLFLSLGTMAHAGYILLALARMPNGDWSNLLLGEKSKLASNAT